MSDGRLTLALVHDVFPHASDDDRLRRYCDEAHQQGVDLVVLPELPLDPWHPQSREVCDDHAEPSGGPRERRLRAIAQASGVAILGGWIARAEGRRYNRAHLIDADGSIRMHYDKLHLPSEEGYWESDHYQPGIKLSAPQELGLRLGVQLCSDLQRPVTVSALVAMGTEVLLHPRATPASSAERWHTVLRATAITQACWVVSVNRPLDAPSWVIAPDGEVLVESEQPLTIVELDRASVARARRDYPGYLDSPAGIYRDSWDALDR